MFHRQRLWLLPPDIQLEVETLLSELRGKGAVPSSRADDAAAAAHGSGHDRSPSLLQLRRFAGGSQTDESR
jgi:hypothetical protein